MIQTTSGHPHARLGVVIPAFNPGTAIVDTLLQLLKLVPPENILVVDDGSTDHTAARVEQLGVSLYRHKSNRGKGVALASGFQRILQLDVTRVLVIDADGQHDPADLPRFCAALTPEYDLIIGDRSETQGEMPWLRRLSNRTSSRIVSTLCRRRIPDSQCGFRLIRSSVIQRLHLVSRHYEYETELLLKVARCGWRIGNLSIAGLYFAESSQIRKWRDTLRFAGLICRSLFWRRSDVVRA
ncbi:glycosyltransferase family 2 protein [bacterium]|nr:glycosyltransferase family 2 protein [bacterium]